jgi:hypothetical protein
MITPLPGWTFHQADDGHVLLVPFDDPTGGVIRYRPRVQPTSELGELVRRYARLSSFALVPDGDPEELTTLEGEHAICARFERTRGGSGVECVAFVQLDDAYAEILGSVRDARRADRLRVAVRTLALHDTHMLGARRRPYPYTPPLGWQRAGCGGSAEATLWVPPDFLADPSELVVLPAMPTGQAPDAAARVLAQLSGPGTGIRVHAMRGPFVLAGAAVWELQIDHLGRAGWTRHVAVLEDERHVYPLHIDAPVERAVAARMSLVEVVRSVRPLPGPARYFRTARIENPPAPSPTTV